MARRFLRYACSFCFAVMLLSNNLGAQSNNPVPLITQPLVPASASPGGAGFTLVVNGAGFVSSSTIQWNGIARTTHFVSASQLTASIGASDIAKAATASVTVTSPSPGGGTSNVILFPVGSPNSGLGFSRSDLVGNGSGAWATVVADFNGDGKMDIATVSSSNNNKVSIFLGNGDGTFRKNTDYTTGSFPFAIVAADFNRDGKLDLATADANATGVSVFLGNGDGTFQHATHLTAIGGPSGLVAADFNGDGNVDLVTADGVGSLSLFKGNGDGTFQPAANIAAGGDADTVIAGDFNGDNHLDLAVTNLSKQTISILLGTGEGGFGAPTTYSVSLMPESMVTADFNGDGKLDLAVTIAGQTGGTPGEACIFPGNGDGTFAAPTCYGAGFSSAGLAIGDINGDGWLDLVVASDSDNTAVVLLGNGDGTFQKAVPFGVGFGPVSVSLGDFNDDGQLDLITGNILGPNSVSVLLQASPTVGASLSPSGLFFPLQIVGKTSVPQLVTLTNTGNSSLTITSIKASGDFQQTNNCGTSLGGGEACSINVTFTPSVIGSRSGMVTVTDNAANSPQRMSLKGTGTIASLSPTDLSYGVIAVGSRSVSKVTTLTNAGAVPLNLSAITITGNDPADFTRTTTCTASLTPGQSCTISVIFAPTAAGRRTATLNVSDDGGGSPQTVSLVGTGR